MPYSFTDALGQMIACATVSYKDHYNDREFAKLRAVMAELFPLVHLKAERMVFGDDCWVYRLAGTDSAHRVMLMSHHDVAEVTDGDHWSHPPFSGEVADGAIWGRGTVDTKGPLFAEFEAVEELLADGWVPTVDLYLSSSCNEEVAGDGIPLAAAYFRQQGIRFDMILDEGGAIIAPPLPGISQKCAMIAVHEKGRCTLQCTADEPAVHAGLSPKTDTPVVRMAKFIAEIAQNPPFLTRLYPEVRAMFTTLAPHMSFPMKLVFSNLWCFGPLLLKLMPKLNPQAGAMVGTQCAFSKISGDNGVHICTAEAFLRCVREEDLRLDIAAFRTVADKYHITVEELENEYHQPADLNSPFLPFVQSCIKSVFPEAASAPFLLPAGTDARHFSDLCSAVLRFAPIDLNQQQFASVHGRDENLGVQALTDAVAFYRHLLTHLPTLFVDRP